MFSGGSVFTCSKCNLLRAECWKILLPSGRIVCAICFPDYFTLNSRRYGEG